MRIGIIGLGYVGLPLAVEFGKIIDTVGVDISDKRINDLKQGVDATLEVLKSEILESSFLKFSSNFDDIEHCNYYIITVPTPIDQYKTPDLMPLKLASKTVSRYLQKGDIVIYESTVFPGATENICVPILENGSSLTFNKDFFCGYSPERINPGDKKHKLRDIMKVTSGSTPEAAKKIDLLYKKIITAGTYNAPSIMVAEAAKVIENTQRDVNIGLINEFSLIFDKMQIDTEEVLNAAETKWNFLPFRPGLVGGHCIGVDPYYLTYQAQSLGYHPEIILSGRRVNDSMGRHVAYKLVKKMAQEKINLGDTRVLLMGLTFKENCPDIRNTGATSVLRELKSFGVQVDCYDPWADAKDAENILGISLLNELPEHTYSAVVVAVAHDKFVKLGIAGIKKLCVEKHIIYDLKYIFNSQEVDIRL
jgi:UDP-N-acetyl-D-glucosamine/UDP-N-acetyl-D-galactosamine dehydrogenase